MGRDTETTHLRPYRRLDSGDGGLEVELRRWVGSWLEYYCTVTDIQESDNQTDPGTNRTLRVECTGVPRWRRRPSLSPPVIPSLGTTHEFRTYGP